MSSLQEAIAHCLRDLAGRVEEGYYGKGAKIDVELVQADLAVEIADKLYHL